MNIITKTWETIEQISIRTGIAYHAVTRIAAAEFAKHKLQFRIETVNGAKVAQIRMK